MPAKTPVGQEMHLRIVIDDSLASVRWWSQHGSIEQRPPQSIFPRATTFELVVRAIRTDQGTIDFRGDVVQGPRGGRFVYLNSGAGGATSERPWSRRAKITLQSITDAHVAALVADPTRVLEAHFHGVARDGGPACASVKLLGEGWKVATPHTSRTSP